MTRFLAETYLPRSRAGDSSRAARCARAAAEQLSREGTSVRHVRTTLLPEDETCFHVFDATSERRTFDARGRADQSQRLNAQQLERLIQILTMSATTRPRTA